MTTKFKIILGFVVMILLLGVVAVIGYINLQSASVGFVDFRRQAGVNVTTSDMVANMNEALSRTFDFMRTGNMETIESGIQSAEYFGELAKAAESETQIPYRQEALQALQKNVEPFTAAQKSVRDSLLALKKQYDDDIRTSYNLITEKMHELSIVARDVQNTDVLFLLTDIWEEFAHCLVDVGRFSESGSQQDALASKERLGNLAPDLEKLRHDLTSERGRNAYAELVNAFKVMNDATESMIVNAEQLRVSVEQLRKFDTEITQRIDALSTRIDAEMDEEGHKVLAANNKAQNIVMGISVAGVAIGAALAALIIFGIIRVLHDLSGFANAISSGNFSYQIKTRERGEIGIVVDAMRQIPTLLSGMIQTMQNLAHSIHVGKLRERGDTSALPGEYKVLGDSINGIANAYTDILDTLPVPMMTCDMNFNVQFYNKAGQESVGGNHVNVPCRDDLRSAVCGTDKCPGRRSLAQNTMVSVESTAHPHGANLDVNITNAPLTDLEGNVAAFMEIVTDLTEIRTQQRTMMDVAHQASEISNRVAAASEELSAQVEQVSRGAEMQRARVESTASAMTEMNSTVLEVARSAGEASEQSEKTREKANDGAVLVNRVVQAINQVNTVAVTLQGNMQELGSQAESIGGVMNVISDIADQTNLLALNAAIEAARAGDAGRGFAVVADEVRKLAEKTMEATHEVGSSITAIQHSARTNIEEVGNAVKNINDATDLANSSGEALKEIVDLASSNSAVVASIATAAEEQSATSEEINHSIEEINQVVGDTTEGMIQSSAAVQELSQMAQELRHVMEGLN